MKTKKVILDTNLWIHFLISKKLDYIDNLVFNKQIRLIFSNELIDEFLTVAHREKFKKYFSDNHIADLIRVFDNYGELINIKSTITKCRDLKDNFLLNLAVDSRADFLVTGDSDLLIIKKIKKTKILNWSDFITQL